MDCLPGLDGTADRGRRTGPIQRWPVRPTLEVLRQSRGYASLRDNAGDTILDPIQKSKLGFADALRVRQDRLERWLQLARRTADDTENLGSRGLLLEGFAQVIRALTQLIEQACVLD